MEVSLRVCCYFATNGYCVTWRSDLVLDTDIASLENYCRNPALLPEIAPWCYTTNPAIKWDLCAVPVCTGKFIFHMHRAIKFMKQSRCPHKSSTLYELMVPSWHCVTVNYECLKMWRQLVQERTLQLMRKTCLLGSETHNRPTVQRSPLPTPLKRFIMRLVVLWLLKRRRDFLILIDGEHLEY